MHKTVLVVDDEERITNHIDEHLSDEGFRVVTATNGKHAQTVLKAQERVDLIITDIGMPGMSGLEFLTFVRSMDKYKNTPCIVLTSHTSEDIIKNAAGKKVSKYLLKPVKVRELKQLVVDLIGPSTHPIGD